ncbi:hypothetical protein K435DRAFT_799256 [Dendrothele bispora CBS 962.96]|uniref:Uncharacterized protein n=1 Tax=Dendrothele bispora (strain CBS 962.96) TaxID=1314807 RepID=A0A4S8LWH4_DENBC|nr:hypothetical protein K435DRAFT_799256 [Dendrothele bispora CBS 962.96]
MFTIIDFLLEEKLSSPQLPNPRSISPKNYGRLKGIMFKHYLHQQPFPENLEFQQALIERGAIPRERRTRSYCTLRRHAREGRTRRVDSSSYIGMTDVGDVGGTAAVVD